MNNEHPIDSLMAASMSNIKEMVDVNTIVGNPVTIPGGTTIIPISKVSFGFAAGGSEFGNPTEKQLPFGGGSGAGVTIHPVGFLVASSDQVKFIPADQPSVTDKLVDYIPELLTKIQELISKDDEKSKNEKKYEGKNGAVYVSEDLED